MLRSNPRFIFLLLLGVATRSAVAAEYDPLKLDSAAPSAEPLDLTVDDVERKRAIPIRAYLPAAKKPAPVVLFSHGLGGSRRNNGYLGSHWSGRGYVVVALQHAGSDEDVWKGKPLGERTAALREAAGLQNFLLRAKDVPAVLDQLAKWNATAGHALAGRLDLEHVGMSGHSFGAVTTQAVAGQSAAGGRVSFTDERIDAAAAFSPSGSRAQDPRQAFGKVRIPWLLMTGTDDVSIIGAETVESRLSVYPALPAGAKYELVLDGAKHSAFSERALPGDVGERNPNHHRAILALTTAFWDAYLRDDAAAKTWLDGDGPRGIIEAQDRWQRK